MSKLIPLLALALLLCIANANINCYAAEITPSDVYAQALRIEQETLALQHQLGITETAEAPKPVRTELSPRHSWAKTYMVLTKITLFREQKKLPAIRPVALEPILNLTPFYNWAQCLRILNEIKIVEQALNITIPTPPTPVITGKQPVDVFNKLNQISALWSVLIGGQITPAYVYAEAMRLNDDVSMLLQMQGVMDTALPPTKSANASPADSLDAGFTVLHEIQKLQLQAGLEPVNLDEFYPARQDAKPQDVFNLIALLLAELQTVKAKLGLKHVITPVAQHYEDKKPADVTQVLGYIANKLHLLNLRQE
ncbi:MAG: hypothetical protein EPN17_04635 [Methylobacter sp.]|nr:MAG: hypothetical protein EPN17_04635 [Methylobacter sp.]